MRRITIFLAALGAMLLVSAAPALASVNSNSRKPSVRPKNRASPAPTTRRVEKSSGDLLVINTRRRQRRTLRTRTAPNRQLRHQPATPSTQGFAIASNPVASEIAVGKSCEVTNGSVHLRRATAKAQPSCRYLRRRGRRTGGTDRIQPRRLRKRHQRCRRRFLGQPLRLRIRHPGEDQSRTSGAVPGAGRQHANITAESSQPAAGTGPTAGSLFADSGTVVTKFDIGTGSEKHLRSRGANVSLTAYPAAAMSSPAGHFGKATSGTTPRAKPKRRSLQAVLSGVLDGEDVEESAPTSTSSARGRSNVEVWGFEAPPKPTPDPPDQRRRRHGRLQPRGDHLLGPQRRRMHL